MIKFLMFALPYGLTKCIKTMLVGTVFMAGIYAAAKRNRGRVPLVDYYALLLLPLALFSGMSRLFYVGGFVWVSAYLNKYCTLRVGGLYFGVAFALFFAYILKNRAVYRRIKGLSEYGNRALAERVKARVCERDATRIGARYVRRVRIFVTGEEVSPYCGGLIHPYVVLPACICGWQETAVETVLCHELVHIRMGHIFVMALYRFLGCLWWIHPLVYACEKRLHEVMEQVCDERVLFVSGVKRETYGQLLLGLVQVLRRRAPSGSAAFFMPVGRMLFRRAPAAVQTAGAAKGHKRSDFLVLEGRLLALGRPALVGRKRRRVTRGFAAVSAALLLLLSVTSYPRYTRMTELGLYDEGLKLCAYDTKELREAVHVRDGRLVVEPERFAALLHALDIGGDYVYVSFDGFMKVPGAGGGGNAGMISLSDYSDIFYLRAEVWENDAMEFLMKYFI